MGVGSRALTKNHFNRNYWVIALPWAKNNISSMLAIRIRSVGPHSWCSPPCRPQQGGLLMLMSAAVTAAQEGPPAQLTEKFFFFFFFNPSPSRAGSQSEKEVGSNEGNQREDTLGYINTQIHWTTLRWPRSRNFLSYPGTHFKWINTP